MEPDGVAAAQAGKPQRLWITEIWHQNREVFKALITDTTAFSFVLLALAVAHLQLQLLEKSGYEKWRVDVLETVHFLGFVIVTVLFLSALIFEVAVLMFRRRG